ncbi:MAG TPA: molybdopterin-dependent oxidoreductase [Solirubrobacteraceae bacterium]|nr:molybdopterin-dependent oxidoreductase [Solirubrobacteraceae bacterium]
MAERITYCRICEANCGMVATVEGDTVVQLRPDRDHPLSAGYACPKGIAFPAVQHDEDRATHPLRRTASGDYERVSWEDALSDIAARLRGLPRESIGWYLGNPAAWSFGHAVWAKGFVDALGSPHFYSSGSQDVNNRFAASALMYGSPLLVPIPDVERTDFLLVVGANPFVSNGSVFSVPRVRDRFRDVVARGGRVVVVDPRRTETAREFEHVPILPDGDAWLLLSMLHVIGPSDPRLRELVAPFAPEATAARTGLDASLVRSLAQDLAAAPSAAVYGRTGSCLGTHGTLVAFLLDALAAVTGNLDCPGGLVFAEPAVDLDGTMRRYGLASYGSTRSRIGDFPDVLGQLPATLMAPEIETPGPGQLRALFVSAGNPVLSVPDGGALERAFGSLDLLVSIDFYVNETGRHADYVLPATTFLEREDVPVAFLPFFVKPFIQWTDAVVAPRGEAREEWAVIDDLARRIGVAPYSVPPLRWLAKLGVRMSPSRLVSLMLLSGPRRLTMKRLRNAPHGLLLDEHHATGRLRKPPSLTPPEIVAEIESLAAAPALDPSLPLRLIGMRELRSHNSWMHNVEKLMRARDGQVLRMHPADAASRSLSGGDLVGIRSASGEVAGVPLLVTDEMTQGVVALPHGWGHRGGWKRANAAGGVNFNELSSAAPESLERLAGMSQLNGIPVEVSLVPAAAPSPESAAAV